MIQFLRTIQPALYRLTLIIGGFTTLWVLGFIILNIAIPVLGVAPAFDPESFIIIPIVAVTGIVLSFSCTALNLIIMLLIMQDDITIIKQHVLKKSDEQNK